MERKVVPFRGDSGRRRPPEDCPVCNGSGWVCEDHPDQPWEPPGQEGSHCGAAGMPCHCNEDAYVGWGTVYAKLQ